MPAARCVGALGCLTESRYLSTQSGNPTKSLTQSSRRDAPRPADKHWYNPFDLTKVWPHGDYPPIDIGEFELNRNPVNYFQEIELAAFSPSNVVPGISFSPDKMLQTRIFSYADAHRYRLGTHYEMLPVNAPRCPVHHYHKDGPMRFFKPLTGNPDAYYELNSFKSARSPTSTGLIPPTAAAWRPAWACPPPTCRGMTA